MVDTQEDNLRRARDHVETRLKKREGHRASFDAIRNEVNETYSDDFLKKLIDENPDIFGRCTIKKGNKPGITLVPLKTEDTQPPPPPGKDRFLCLSGTVWTAVGAIAAIITIIITIPTWHKPKSPSSSENIPVPTQNAPEKTKKESNVSFIWQATPWAESGYSYSNYVSYSDGFKITVVKSKQMKNSHIQVHNENPIILAPKAYKMTFVLLSDKDFVLFSRLGEQDHLTGNSYIEYRLKIVGNGKETEHTIPFTGYSGNNFLYFQFGLAPPNTHIVIKGIKVTPGS